ncbi:hypothetical protein CFOL_v3_34827 [Cephalotus follicularis]|uniref:Rhodanese domain-containing protein n=1 Tax=Cephalotus follicularis TaxID=3775 RepID=A0A1Q3DG59_CEPFO|nr:hypothetical protein CFOL_v3_34827 [Cephalotus follicularis]
MEALKAASLTPISVLCETRSSEPRKFTSLSTTSSLKLSNNASFCTNPQSLKDCLSRNLYGSVVLLASVLSTGFSLAKALTYEEALQQSVSTSTSDFDASGILNSFISFGTENPLVIAGGGAVLAVPLIVSRVLKKPKSWGVESARTAYARLSDEANSELLDIRAPVEFRQVGSPDIRGLGKKPVSVVYKGEDKNGFLKKLSLKFKQPEDTTLFILDKFDGNSELVAELVALNGFKAAYAIKDGAEGTRGWMNSGLPWTPPNKAFSLDLSSFTESISDALGEGSDGLSVALGIAAATGLGLLAFSEVEIILQVLGSAALVQFFSKKLLFAEDRKETVKAFDEFLNTKVAPKELVDEIKQIGRALLPSPLTSKALPAPAKPSPEAPTVQKAEGAPELDPEPKVEAVREPTPLVNSIPKPEIETESLPRISRPLSPYPSVLLISFFIQISSLQHLRLQCSPRVESAANFLVLYNRKVFGQEFIELYC